MKFYKSTDDLPKWFDLKKYICISKLSNSEIKKQVQYRADLINSVKWAYAENETDENGEQCLFEYGDYKRNEQITKGDVVLVEFRDVEMERLTKEQNIANGCDFKSHDYLLPCTQAVSGYKTMSAYYHARGLINEGLIKQDDEYTYFKNELSLADVDIAAKVFGVAGGYGSASVSIDLENHTDKEIIADIIKLLPEWRKCLEIEEPDGILYSKELDYKKVVSYRIIPLLDLMLHEKINNKKFPLRVLATALYPKAEKGENELKQTVIPLALRITSDNYRYLD